MRGLPLAAALCLLCAPTGAVGAEWALSAGSFAPDESLDGPFIGSLELRLDQVELWRPSWGVLVPAFGVAMGEASVFYAYGGFDLHVFLTERWRFTGQAGAGLYDDGDGKDLGGPLEFRTGVQLDYRVSRRARAGLSFFHLSNAGIYDCNPGVNTLAVTVVFGGAGVRYDERTRTTVQGSGAEAAGSELRPRRRELLARARGAGSDRRRDRPGGRRLERGVPRPGA